MLMVWTHGEEKQDDFIEYLNNIHTTIKFTGESSTMSNIPFVDVNVQLRDGKIETDLYWKPTDKDQYLLYALQATHITLKSLFPTA